MVRVVSCHHFLSQDVFLSQNEPVAFCCAQGKLLIATTQHAVNVHDLESRGNVLHSFPTVDLVKQIIYCESGNYVATVESKASWHRSLVTYVRIYFKWWIEVNGQPLKVRIAGCIPPSTNSQPWSKMFEMVELPLDKTALCISCCNKTSALAVSVGNTISLFSYSIKVDPSSKHTFHDFDHFVDISVPILVQDLKMCENYFACMSDRAVHVFKIVGEKTDSNQQNFEVTSDFQNDYPDSELYDENFVEWRFESCTNSGFSDKKWEQHLESRLHPKSFPINIHLCSIDKENEKFSSKEECEIFGPLLTIRGCTIDLRLDPKIFEIFPAITPNVNAVTLLFRQFAPKENKFSLTSLQLIPICISEKSYTDFNDPLNAAASALEKCSFSLPWPDLNSSSCLKAIGCFFSTPQEGLLYDVTFKTRLVNAYTYTAALKEVVVETSLLHALTETGLETYTVHLPLSALHYIERFDGVKNILPNYSDDVCLLGLRPFLGVDHLVMSENHVILVSSIEDSVSNNETDSGNRSTLYSLKKATPVQVFMDLLEAGETHKGTSSSMYYNLLSAAHMILRTQLLCSEMKDSEAETLYKKSCLLLADYFVCSSDSTDQLTAVPYYYLSQLSPESIIQRMVDLSHQNKHIDVLKPLVHYLNSLLLDDDPQVKFSPSQAITDVILSAYTEEAPEMLWKIVLCSDLTGYKMDKIILTLKRRLTSKRHPLSPISNAADSTALVYLLLQKGNTESAQNMLLSLSKGDLVTVLNNVHSRLWSGKKLSMLGKFIKETRPDAFIELLLGDIENKKANVSEIIQLFQNEAPNFDLQCVPLLKEFLEALLSDKEILSQVDSSILTLLVKIYLKRLLETPTKSSSPSNPFSGNMASLTLLFGSRPTWLNEMPPFSGKGISRTCILSSGNGSKSDNFNIPTSCCCWTCNEDLLRLQSLLSHLGPSEEVKGLVLDFLCSAKDSKTNWLSLEVMCCNEAQAIKILIGISPKALLPYAKDTIGTEEKKWCMLFKLLHEHMLGLSDDNPQLEVYSQTFHGVLAHLAETLKPVEFLGLLPPGENPVFIPHLKRCIEKHQADQLKSKIMSLGQEIKCMMLY